MLNKNLPLVSIIIPLYNAETFIAQTLQSVLDQTFREWELIVVDDCSTDKSRQIVNQFAVTDNRITLIESAINFGGPAKPRNIGIEKAKGEYIAFLDADDIWLPEKLEKQLKFIQTNNLNFSSCNCSLIDEQNTEISLGWKGTFANKIFSKKTLCDVIKHNFILTSSAIIHKDIVLNFNESTNFISVEDYDLWIRTLSQKNTRYKYQNEKLIIYRVVTQSVSQRSQTLRQELKSHIVLSNFMLDHQEYIWCWYHRILIHLFYKQIKKKFTPKS